MQIGEDHAKSEEDFALWVSIVSVLPFTHEPILILRTAGGLNTLFWIAKDHCERLL